MVRLEEADFSVIGDSIDLNQVPALPLAHTVAYVNQTMTIMVQHLNHFARRADERLRQLSASICKLETELTILEAKLSSIPGLDAVNVSSASTVAQSPPERPWEDNNSAPPVASQQTPTATPEPTTVNSPSPQAQSNHAVPVNPSPVPDKVEEVSPPPVFTVQSDPVFAKYFRMVKMGVPIAAVKLKMTSEGVEPSYLDTPNAPSPNPSEPAADEGSYGSSTDEED